MKIRVDIRPMTNTLHLEWDGEEAKTFKKYLKLKKNASRIINKLHEIINNENIEETKLNFEDREATIIFNGFITTEEINQITNKLTMNDLIAYKL